MLIGVPLETAAGLARAAVMPGTTRKLEPRGNLIKLPSDVGSDTRGLTRSMFETAPCLSRAHGLEMPCSPPARGGGAVRSTAADPNPRRVPMQKTAAGAGGECPEYLDYLRS